MPELQLNSGPQDALLYDNTRSYFTNVGYVRTSNFQLKLRDVDPINTARLGTTVQFVIPKAADLLGPIDLVLELAEAQSGTPFPDPYAASNSGTGYHTYVKGFTAWVEAVGFAMIDKIVFSVGTQTIETITGDQLNIMNELMTSDSKRLGRDTILKTSRTPVRTQTWPQTGRVYPHEGDSFRNPSMFKKNRLITLCMNAIDENGQTVLKSAAMPGTKKLIVPLGLFFTKHPSQYLPLAAISAENEVRVSVKMRTLAELVLMSATDYSMTSGTYRSVVSSNAPTTGTIHFPTFDDDQAIVTGSCKLRCHMMHVTGPERAVMMNKEHVRLLKLWQVNTKTVSLTPSVSKTQIASIDLSFLHPVTELIITVRKASEMSSSTSTDIKPSNSNQGAITKNYFAYHGGDGDPNIERLAMRHVAMDGFDRTCLFGMVDTGTANDYVAIDNFKLSLNGQERHESLAANSLDHNYLMNRLMPMMHSNTSSVFECEGPEMDALTQTCDRKQIYVYPFSLNPEGSNPSGAVNFSKVSHAKLDIEGTVTGSAGVEYQVDVYGVHYNWLQIRDGRALTSFS